MNAVERFTEHIPLIAYASAGRINGQFSHARKMPKEIAIDMAIVQANIPRCVRYLCFDIDDPWAALTWEDANAPPPNLIIVNPQNGHAHLVYELEKPVWLRKRDDGRSGDASPVRYLRAIQKALQRDLGADPYYNGLMIKNPLNASWNTYSPRQSPYTLTELAAHLDLDVLPQRADLQDSGIGRNVTLFDSIRLWAYRAKRHFNSYGGFYDALMEELDRLNDLIGLGAREVHGIGKSVASWVWNTYTGSGRVKRRGIMGLDKREPIQVRQQQGQSYTSARRVEKTEARIRSVIHELQLASLPVRKSIVARKAKISRNTVYAYWERVSDLFTDNVTLDSVSLRDESQCSLRSQEPSAHQTDTLIPTQQDITESFTYQQAIEYFRVRFPTISPVLKAASLADRLARKGVLMTGLPQISESRLRIVIDNFVLERQMNEQSTTFGFA